jgi:hypothetical protein
VRLDLLSDEETTKQRNIHEEPRRTILDVLAEEGLAYQRGGKITEKGLSGAIKTLAELLKIHPIEAVEHEIERAIAQVNSDPPGALTAACSLVEAVRKTILEVDGISLPTDQSIKPLWNALSKHLPLDPGGVPVTHPLAADMRKVLSGLFTTIEGLGAFRTHGGHAHGRSGAPLAPNMRSVIQPRHARLAVHSAHTAAIYALETWEWWKFTQGNFGYTQRK